VRLLSVFRRSLFRPIGPAWSGANGQRSPFQNMKFSVLSVIASSVSGPFRGRAHECPLSACCCLSFADDKRDGAEREAPPLCPNSCHPVNGYSSKVDPPHSLVPHLSDVEILVGGVNGHTVWTAELGRGGRTAVS
jgi:hypothetical protein